MAPSPLSAHSTRSTSLIPERFLRRIRPQERAAFTRQLATLVGAGIPVVGALDAIIQQTSQRGLRRALVDIREEIQGGSPLADALGRHRWLLSELYVNMVHAGETSGGLEAVLHRLADLLERTVKLKTTCRPTLKQQITNPQRSIFVTVAFPGQDTASHSI